MIAPNSYPTHFAIPDTTQTSFRDDNALLQGCVATRSDFAHSALEFAFNSIKSG